jgi:hypothetical protein
MSGESMRSSALYGEEAPKRWSKMDLSRGQTGHKTCGGGRNIGQSATCHNSVHGCRMRHSLGVKHHAGCLRVGKVGGSRFVARYFPALGGPVRIEQNPARFLIDQ